MNLSQFGWDSYFEDHFNTEKKDGQIPGRIFRENKNRYKVMTESGMVEAGITGKFYHQSVFRKDFPALGDWVLLSPPSGEMKALIHGVLPRRTKFSRKVPGKSADEQILASNMDTIFIVTALNQDYSLRRIERYLVLAWNSGADPVVVLSKSDLAENLEAKVLETEAVSGGVRVIAVSAKTGLGLEDLKSYLKPGKTIALIGSSGVGKSTLINAILGREDLKTAEIRESDGEGRHTTTWREIIFIPGGGMVMDHPGLREVGMTGAGTGLKLKVFEEIEKLAEKCRFRDCGHTNEPGCAVVEAIQAGEIDQANLQSYFRLQKETAYMKTKNNALEKEKEQRRWKKISQDIKKYFKDKS